MNDKDPVKKKRDGRNHLISLFFSLLFGGATLGLLNLNDFILGFVERVYAIMDAHVREVRIAAIVLTIALWAYLITYFYLDCKDEDTTSRKEVK